MYLVTKDMVITDILEIDRTLIPMFFRYGLNCVGCAVSVGETLEEACEVHGLDVDTLLYEINEHLMSRAGS